METLAISMATACVAAVGALWQKLCKVQGALRVCDAQHAATAQRLAVLEALQRRETSKVAE